MGGDRGGRLPARFPVRLTSIAEEGLTFEIRFWIDDPEEGLTNVRSDILNRLWELFRENQMQIPFPQRDIRIKAWPEPPPVPGADNSPP